MATVDPTDYANFFLGTQSSLVLLETLEISHPSFSQIYRIVRNATAGITAETEENVNRTFTYYPCDIQNSSVSDDMDYSLKISFGDLGEILPVELDNVITAGTIDTKPTVKYRLFQSGSVSHKLIEGPITLEIRNIAFNEQGCTFDAVAPSINNSRIGTLYTLDLFPTLRGFAT